MEFIITLLVIGFVFWVVSRIIGVVPMVSPYKDIIMGFLILVAVIILLRMLAPLLNPYLGF